MKILPEARTSFVRRRNFSRIDHEREARGATPLPETLTALLAAHERERGTVRKIMDAQERLQAVLPREHRQLLLDLEAAHVGRLIDAEELVFDVGFEMGLAHGRVQGLGSAAARKVATELGELLATSDAKPHEVVQALAVVLAGVVQPFVTGDEQRPRRVARIVEVVAATDLIIVALVVRAGAGA